MYAGLLSGYLAGLSGPNPHRIPLLLDFDLKLLHGVHVNAGVGNDWAILRQASAPRWRAHQPQPLARSIHRDHCCIWARRGFARNRGLGPACGDENLLPAAEAAEPVYQKPKSSRFLYHRDGSLLEVAEAVVSGVYEDSQVEVLYRNGLRVCVNGSWSNDWIVEHETREYRLPPASFLAHSPDGLLVYSAGRRNWTDGLR